MIAHLSYVICDVCFGRPAQPGDDHREARNIAHNEGYCRERRDGRLVDVCPSCQTGVA